MRQATCYIPACDGCGVEDEGGDYLVHFASESVALDQCREGPEEFWRVRDVDGATKLFCETCDPGDAIESGDA
jgi:hypothetical protein